MVMRGRTILDIKTGRAQPWTALQLAAYTLLDTPVIFQPEGHRYTWEGRELESVTTILQAEGYIDTRWFDDWSRDKGTAVHLAVHYEETGGVDEHGLDPVIAPYLEAWRAFKDATGWETQESEPRLMSSVHLYAGTPDVVGHLPGITRAAVELTPDGSYRLVPYRDRADVQVWLAILAGRNWKKNNLRRQKRCTTRRRKW